MKTFFTGLLILLLGSISLGAQSVDPAALVRAVRQGEQWIGEFETLYILAEMRWVQNPSKQTVPESASGRRAVSTVQDGETKVVTQEFAIGPDRVRYYQDDPSYYRTEEVWDGRELRDHEKYYNSSQEHFLRESKPQGFFKELLPCNLGWPRSQPYSFWYDPRNVESLMELYGPAEEFRYTGETDFRGRRCRQLDYTVPEASGLEFRWLVGAEDGMLYGIQTRRNGVTDVEHWWEDYQPVLSGRMPMRNGWTFYEGEQVRSACTVTVKDFRVNEPLDAELFNLELKEGVKIQDLRSGQLEEYVLAADPKKRQAAEATESCTAADECRMIFADSGAQIFEMESRFGGEDRLSGRPMEGPSLRVHEIELSYAPPLNAQVIPQANIRYGKLAFADAGGTVYHCALAGGRGDGYSQRFFIDLNRNGRWEDGETFEGRKPSEGDQMKTWFGRVDLSLVNEAGQPFVHPVFAVYNHYDQLFVVSHGWKAGTIEIGGETKEAVLLDYNCDGRFDSGRPIREQRLFMEPSDASYDYVAWDENGDGKLGYEEMHSVGSYACFGGRVYRVAAREDGSQAAVTEADVPTGKLMLPYEDACVRLRGSRGPVMVGRFHEPLAVPADTYYVEYSVYRLPGEEESARHAKDGRYYHAPWVIEAGKTLEVTKKLLEVSDLDRTLYDQKVNAFRQQQEFAQLEALEERYNSITGEALQSFSDFEMPERFEMPEGALLVCFWDFGQRPSRAAVRGLAERKEALAAQGIGVLLIHAGAMDESAAAWLEEQGAGFTAGSLTGDTEAVCRKWGARGLPWLILTDDGRRVTAEGISMMELEERLGLR